MAKTKKKKNQEFSCGLKSYEESKDFKTYEKQFKKFDKKKIIAKTSSLSDYIPNQTTDLKIICVNYHIMQDDNGLGNWSIQDIPALKEISNWCNSAFVNPDAPSDPIAAGGIIPLQDSRIRFKLNKIEFYRDSNLINSISTTALFTKIIERDPSFLSSLNIFFTNGTIAGSAFASLPNPNINYNSFVVMLKTYQNQPVSNYAASQLMAHEVGHVLGLCHTYLGGGCSANCNEADPDFLYDVFGNSPSTCPHLPNWGIDAYDNSLPNAEKYTNNLMGGNQSNKWISSLQAAKMHRNLETTSVSKYLINNCECMKCVAFSAQGSGHISAGADQKLSYSNTILNEGWSWDGSEFKAPVKGIYSFDISFVKDSYYHGGTQDDVNIILIKNSSSLGNAWSGEGTGRRGTGSFSINLKLEKGDKIFTRIHSDGGRKRHVANYNFNGKLICSC